MYEIIRFFTINSLFFVQICPNKSEILWIDSKNSRASNGYVLRPEQKARIVWILDVREVVSWLYQVGKAW